MYDDDKIKDMFASYIVNEEYFQKYVDVYKCFKSNDTESLKYNFHHFFPVNYGKEIMNEKNRYHSIEKHDELYSIEDNVVKLPIKWHVISHYYLAKATYRENDINSFFALIGDYSRSLDSYSVDEVLNIADMVEEVADFNKVDHYMTLSERKAYLKEKNCEFKEKYKSENKDYIDEQKQKIKLAKKEYLENWKKEHKEEIEEKKRKQKEYLKMMRAKYK